MRFVIRRKCVRKLGSCRFAGNMAVLSRMLRCFVTKNFGRKLLVLVFVILSSSLGLQQSVSLVFIIHGAWKVGAQCKADDTIHFTQYIFITQYMCRDPSDCAMPRGRPQASCLGQVESYRRDRTPKLTWRLLGLWPDGSRRSVPAAPLG